MPPPMKYCSQCNVEAPEDQEFCAQCGKPLIRRGALAKGLPPGITAEQAATMPAQILRLRQDIEEVRVEKTKKSRGILRLALVCAGAAVGVLAVAFGLYYHSVLSYAELDAVVIQQAPDNARTVAYSFKIVTPGKVRFIRRSGRYHAEKLDRFPERARGGKAKASWMWYFDPKHGLDFTVRFRRGYFPAKVRQTFGPQGSARGSVPKRRRVSIPHTVRIPR